MPVPYGRTSKAKGRQRRAANMKYVGVNVQKCPSCGEPVLAHRICPSCGKYHDRQVLEKQGV